MQEKHVIKKKKSYFAFVDLENIFDHVPHPLLWCAMRKLWIDQWIARLVKTMYNVADSRGTVNGCFSKRFEVTVGVHQGSVLSLLLFILSWVLYWLPLGDTQGLRVNIGETKILGLLGEAQKPTRNVEWPCGVCFKRVRETSTLCQTCNIWIHKIYLGVKGTLKEESMFRCKKCKGESALTGRLNSTKYMLVKTNSKLCQLFNTLVMWLKSWMVV